MKLLKTLTLFLLCSLLAVAKCYGWGVCYFRPVVTSGGCAGSCSTYSGTAFHESTPLDGAASVHTIAGEYYGGVIFANTSARCLGRVRLVLTKYSGSVTGFTYVVRIWSVSGTSLNTELGNSAGVTGSDSWNDTAVDFDFSAPVSLDASTSYAITIDHAGYDGSNFIKIDMDTGAGDSSCATYMWDSGGTVQDTKSGDQTHYLYECS